MPIDVADLGEFEDTTLKEYVAKLQAFWDESGDENTANGASALEQFVRLGITGRMRRTNKVARIIMTDCYVTPEQVSEFTIRRDYDSLIGWSHDLPLQCPVDIYMIPRFRDTLKKDIHIKYPLRVRTNGVDAVSGRGLTCLRRPFMLMFVTFFVADQNDAVPQNLQCRPVICRRAAYHSTDASGPFS
jgi:hypothetical protein